MQLSAISKAVGKIQDAAESLREQTDDLYTRLDELFEGRSEAWKESEKGQDFADIISSLETLRDELESLSTDIYVPQ
jgi:hypothetical protein